MIRHPFRSAGCSLVLLALAVGATGCQNNDEAEAVARVESYLDAASGAADDRGWSLLAGDRDAIFGERDDYVALAFQGDWDRFEWRVVDAHCDDGACTVWIEVPSEDAIPDALARGIVTYRVDHVPEGANATILVSQQGMFGDGVLAVDRQG